MPHFIVEYTANIKDDLDIPKLLRQANETLIAQDGVFPIGGIRSRAIELKDYCIADGRPEYGFLHATLKIGHGRSAAVKNKVCEELFALLKQHLFAGDNAQRPLALSMELYEFDEDGTFRHNNLHARFRKNEKV
ncbi:MAG TPA: 5-carboxymethyl-2-hydroxymuconate Delta-isomerase [Povalibacter sp.]|nr:5-carboxymethyl-2-hydroxymuconate Delta-isomerase [Povalibacter sp.]